MTSSNDFAKNLIQFMEETFEPKHHGIYLDKGTSLFETLETVSAGEASIPVGGKCASLAAQVAHVTLAIEVIEKYFLRQAVEKVDWGEIWRTIEKVTSEEWDESKRKLRDAYQHALSSFQSNQTWDDDAIGNSMAVLVHTAYHLGEIRQALCTLKG